MPIVSSSIVRQDVQRDGRRSVREMHTDHLGIPHYAEYLADKGADLIAPMQARATQISTDQTNMEIAANLFNAINYQQMPTNNYSAPAQNITALRTAFATLSQWDVTRLGNFIWNLNLSDVSLENVFGVSAGAQLTALKTKLSGLAATYAATVAAQGQ